MLQLSDLKKRYDTGDYALKGVTLDVPQGQVLALIAVPLGPVNQRLSAASIGWLSQARAA